MWEVIRDTTSGNAQIRKRWAVFTKMLETSCWRAGVWSRFKPQYTAQISRVCKWIKKGGKFRAGSSKIGECYSNGTSVGQTKYPNPTRNLWPRETDMTQRPSFKCTIFVNLHVNIFYLGCGWNGVRHLRCATWVWISGGWYSSWRSSKRNRRVTVEQMSTKYFATRQRRSDLR